MFWRRKPKILIIEQPVTSRPQILKSEDARLSAETLGAHPGFQYLLEKLRHARAMYKTMLETRQCTDLREVIFLQAAIFWSGWLEQQVLDTLPSLRAGQPVNEPSTEVAALFSQAQAAIEEVGVKTE